MYVPNNRLAVITTDPFLRVPSAIQVKHIGKDPADLIRLAGMSLLHVDTEWPSGKINRAVEGHFVPTNALAFNPEVNSFSSGGEDGNSVQSLLFLDPKRMNGYMPESIR